MSIGSIEFNLQTREISNGDGPRKYEMLSIESHDDDRFVTLTGWDEFEGDEDTMRNIRAVSFPVECLDRVITYLKLVAQWDKDVKSTPIAD